ncbi:protein-L-isoaspartate(D-aspartate) O-methyltransferase [Chitinivorax tropicus]|uniref:Protein-L-isoaspartate O-methyltransferase n=1 Tax=Chitinivorax tropicus TaxID=714531 RepID=A0A840MRG0_9PROT|nr:protein-L-isoaspartate O-methyltransferase [Chitinivorax tropicus]MBB5019372.1 protein-L-isoaspartate(D-aspartate) O-methyltransferase [Chitinivorax tropicus]
MNWEEARFNMVEQQIRPWDVLDQEILSLLFEVKREEFVPTNMHNLAFVDMELPLANGQKMWQPKLEARVVQELAIKRTDKVLEIGSGSGYLTALLAKRAQHVYSVEIDAEQAAIAKSNLLKAGLGNVTFEVGDGARGWTKHAPYDVIVITGSVPVLPDEFKQQLAVGGRLFAVIGDAPVMSGTLITHESSAAYNTTKLFETVVTPLMNAVQPARFSF